VRLSRTEQLGVGGPVVGDWGDEAVFTRLCREPLDLCLLRQVVVGVVTRLLDRRVKFGLGDFVELGCLAPP
jgi:hypothetical protein